MKGEPLLHTLSHGSNSFQIDNRAQISVSFNKYLSTGGIILQRKKDTKKIKRSEFPQSQRANRCAINERAFRDVTSHPEINGLCYLQDHLILSYFLHTVVERTSINSTTLPLTFYLEE